MDTLVIRGVSPWDGEYPLDLDAEPFTYREWGYLKRYSGYLPLTIREGIVGSDPGLLAALALIVLRRNERIDEADLPSVHERFLDAPFDLEDGTSVELRLAEVEADADGPPIASSNGNTVSSGGRSSRNSAQAGIPDLVISELTPPA